jgi:Gpi18-like mannosyltransferase
MPIAEPLKTIWPGTVRNPSVRTAVFAFALSRLVVFTIFILGTNLKVVEPNRIFLTEAEEIEVSLSAEGIINGLRSLATRGDGGWYLHIAHRGYERIPFERSLPHNWAFFPLFPLLWRAAATFTGGYLLTGIALSNLLFFFALLVLHRTALAFNLDGGSANRAVFYLAIFPASYFFSLPLAESLFLLLTAGCFLAAKRNSWWAAALLAALASTTRLTGLMLLPALWLLQWQATGTWKPRLQTLSLLLVPTGLVGYMIFLHSITGNPLAFAGVESAWGRQPQFFVQTLFEYLSHPLNISYKWNFKLLNFAAALLALVCSAVLMKRRQWSLGFYVLVATMLPLFSGTLQSMARYVMVLFPIFFVLGGVGATSKYDRVITTVFLVLLGIMTLLCTIIVTLALS